MRKLALVMASFPTISKATMRTHASSLLANNTARKMSTSPTSNPRVAVIGAGITGATAASVLVGSDLFAVEEIIVKGAIHIHVDIFDQGRSGPGGRASHRNAEHSTVKNQKTIVSPLKWDHGCQFFRADTPRMKSLVTKWLSLDLCNEWKGPFLSFPSNSTRLSTNPIDFFGIPSQPPFYTWGGKHTLPYILLNQNSINKETCTHNPNISVYTGTRVSGVERIGSKWFLSGTSGKAAFHDTITEKKTSNLSPSADVIGHTEGYDAIICTDVSSSFSSWHRASANLPSSFTKQVREKVGSRVPLFTSLIAFDRRIELDASAIVFNNENIDESSDGNNRTKNILWFAARNNSKKGMEHLEKDCWTLVSTPEYAMQCIEEEPMQDPKTKEFRPQTKEYLLQKNDNGPGYVLEQEFLKYLQSELGDTTMLPTIIHRDAQRWGSAMPARKNPSPMAKKILDVDYDLPSENLAPTVRLENEVDAKTVKGFIADDKMRLYQAGDMVSDYTAGFEAAVLSGVDVAEHVRSLLLANH